MFDVFCWLMVVFAVYANGFSVALFSFSRVFGLRSIVTNKVFCKLVWGGRNQSICCICVALGCMGE